ncbi:membrane protein [Escherichia coli LAU-EC6]|uniref:Membrane protein n=1 Tax=Escherichia coli 1-250-04_S3_C1 TaxID=1444135 RepID=A0AAN4NMH9_ECOLX|nr:membrane protein [Escherichia coli Nissle 1917]AKE84958.1 membrane protein [Escherichia coli O104:H4 str. C227-11]ALY15793.1 hypothetical protein ACN002_4335 [Escherichia coli]EGR60416.1 hypothetical protein HUSEC41_25662 [Escherichia coli O104:H4 str. 01-09591]EGR71106.1 hypothetical protein HUSEC_27326 [Escherichia coli O104:H4 str. LB226692]EGW88650.1 putative membrane protein [Escherichia coli STEC_EH250]EGX03919.1 putative membrane protein [Escherichia coli STEC_MHI813]EHV62931.1 put
MTMMPIIFVVVVKLCVLVAVMTYNKHFCKLIPDQVQAC